MGGLQRPTRGNHGLAPGTHAAMPVTPFHFGPGGAIHALAPGHVSFLAFCAANVLIDLEPLHYMQFDQGSLHRFFHTYVGASLIAAATVLIFLLALKLAARVKLPNPFQWQALKPVAVVTGAVTGSYSHIVLDSVMHADIRPWSPFSEANGLYRVISLDQLHAFCVWSGAAALVVIVARRLLQAGAKRPNDH